ncbi:hypothetical protein ACFL6U_23375 [Planctomycetota bacterium]
MKPFNQSPLFLAQIFSQYVKAFVIILLWVIIALSSIAGAYVIIHGLWAGVKYVLTSFVGI